MNPRLGSFIATRDARATKLRGRAVSPMADHFSELVERGRVVVGGRSTSGPVTDPTWVEFRMWNEVVRKARQLGYRIEESNIKHGNGWATKNGGFWDEREYRLTNGIDKDRGAVVQ